MAIKDWKIIEKESEEIIWENKKNGYKVGIAKTFAQEWTGRVNKGNDWESFDKISNHLKGEPDLYRNKGEAIKFAKLYMRTH